MECLPTTRFGLIRMELSPYAVIVVMGFDSISSAFLQKKTIGVAILFFQKKKNPVVLTRAKENLSQVCAVNI